MYSIVLKHIKMLLGEREATLMQDSIAKCFFKCLAIQTKLGTTRDKDQQKRTEEKSFRTVLTHVYDESSPSRVSITEMGIEELYSMPTHYPLR